MDRLTFLDNGNPAFNLRDCVYKNEIARKLYAYEDTGLTPEEITAMKADNERLHRLLDKAEEIVQSAVSAPKSDDCVHCRDCAYLNVNNGEIRCGYPFTITNGLDDWCHRAKKRKEREDNA